LQKILLWPEPRKCDIRQLESNGGLLKNSQRTLILPTNASLQTWLPGDIVHDETLFVPLDIPVGKYQIEIAIVSPVSFEPRIKLAISGVNNDGWYPMGDILVED